jgi:hypothetical protein
MLDGHTLVHVLNKSDAPDALPIEQFARLADGLPDIIIPFDEEFAQWSLMGMTQRNAQGKVDVGLEPLIAKISGIAPSPQASSRSILSKLFRK